MQIVGGALDDELINLFIAGILTAGIMLATRCMSAAQVRNPPVEVQQSATLLRVRLAPQSHVTESRTCNQHVWHDSTVSVSTELRCWWQRCMWHSASADCVKSGGALTAGS